jgi:hypothetical protein
MYLQFFLAQQYNWCMVTNATTGVRWPHDQDANFALLVLLSLGEYLAAAGKIVAL